MGKNIKKTENSSAGKKRNNNYKAFCPDFSENLIVIAGPCIIESMDICMRIADKLSELSRLPGVNLIFKASYDKANRTSRGSFRGPGLTRGLKILEKVGKVSGLPLCTDIHESYQAQEVAQVVDVIQIPALLSRQTDLLVSAGKTGKIVNIKKGQFMAPADMFFAIEKAGKNCWITERGTFFGYNRLVVDFAAVPALLSFGKPVIFDATHSVQLPGAGKGRSAGNRNLALPLAKAALAVGVDGLFFEVHPDPDHALCDGPNSLQLDMFARELPRLIELREFLKRNG